MGERRKRAKYRIYEDVAYNILHKDNCVICRERENKVLESFRTATTLSGSVLSVRKTKLLSCNGSRRTKHVGHGGEESYKKTRSQWFGVSIATCISKAYVRQTVAIFVGQ